MRIRAKQLYESVKSRRKLARSFTMYEPVDGDRRRPSRQIGILRKVFPGAPVPVRKIVKRAPHRPVGFFMSEKMMGPLEWESYLERDNFFVLETDNWVRAYYPQPVTLDLTFQGKPRTYTPDVMVVRRDGTSSYVEVKPDAVAKKPVYQEFFAAARARAADHGLGFEIATELEIRRQPRLKNAKTLMTYSKVQPKGRLLLDVADALTTGRCATVADLMVALNLPEERLGELYALALRGDLNIDLGSAPLSMQSRISRPYN